MRQQINLFITKKIQASPITVTDKEIRKACRRPLVSDIKFITIRPVNEPTGKQA